MSTKIVFLGNFIYVSNSPKRMQKCFAMQRIFAYGFLHTHTKKLPEGSACRQLGQGRHFFKGELPWIKKNLSISMWVLKNGIKISLE